MARANSDASGKREPWYGMEKGSNGSSDSDVRVASSERREAGMLADCSGVISCSDWVPVVGLLLSLRLPVVPSGWLAFSKKEVYASSEDMLVDWAGLGIR
jgi:hypothetical protein